MGFQIHLDLPVEVIIPAGRLEIRVIYRTWWQGKDPADGRLFRLAGAGKGIGSGDPLKFSPLPTLFQT
jgi:hypothetical protein